MEFELFSCRPERASGALDEPLEGLPGRTSLIALLRPFHQPGMLAGPVPSNFRTSGGLVPASASEAEKPDVDRSCSGLRRPAHRHAGGAPHGVFDAIVRDRASRGNEEQNA